MLGISSFWSWKLSLKKQIYKRAWSVGYGGREEKIIFLVLKKEEAIPIDRSEFGGNWVGSIWKVDLPKALDAEFYLVMLSLRIIIMKMCRDIAPEDMIILE